MQMCACVYLCLSSQVSSFSNGAIIIQNVTENKSVRERHAVRAIKDEDSTLFAISTLKELLSPSGEPLRMPRFHHKSWIRVSSCASSTPQCPITVVETYATLIPKMDSYTTDYSEKWTSVNLECHLIPYLDPKVTDSQQRDENELFKISMGLQTPGCEDRRGRWGCTENNSEKL